MHGSLLMWALVVIDALSLLNSFVLVGVADCDSIRPRKNNMPCFSSCYSMAVDAVFAVMSQQHQTLLCLLSGHR